MTRDQIKGWIKPQDEILRRTNKYLLIRRTLANRVIFAWATSSESGRVSTLGEARKSILEALEREEIAEEAAKMAKANRIASTLPVSSSPPEDRQQPHARVVSGLAGDCVWAFPDGQKEGAKVVIQRLPK